MNSPSPPAEFDLYLTRLNAGLTWRLKDHGIRLAGDHIGWSLDGRTDEARLADIAEVQLYGGHPQLPWLFTCALRFRNGTGFRVSSGSDMGGADLGRQAIYRDFVEQLHARLGPAERTAIRFTAGAHGWRARALPWMGPLLLGLTGLLVLGLLAVVLLTGDLRAMVLLLGAVPMWLTWRRALQANAPRSYDPGGIPGELLPQVRREAIGAA
jgi:hypothetical protein